MALVDLDDEFLNLFYNITNSKIPAEPSLLDLKKQLINITLVIDFKQKTVYN